MSTDHGRGSRRTEVGLELLSTAILLRRALDEDMARRGGSLAQSKLLKVLDRSGELTQARLADELGLAARSVTQSVIAMEKADLVRRTSDNTDRRAKLVSITAAGRRALAACDTDGDALMERALGQLDATQLDSLSELLHHIDTALSTRKTVRDMLDPTVP